MATTIEATYKVVTPLFCAGADYNQAEVRLPSFKGVLRFWWRALSWSRCSGDLAAIKQQEDALFGSTITGQSRILMRLVPALRAATVHIGQILTIGDVKSAVVGEGARYLGYGVMEAFNSKEKNTKAGQLTRACLRPPIEFTVSIRARDLALDQIQSLKQALIVVGMLGGVGAKSRKGYGSLVLRSLRVNGSDEWECPTTVEELKEKILALYSEGARDGQPEFTALSKNTRHVVLTANVKEPIQMLDLIGREFVRFRSWGRKGKIFGEQIDSEKRFKEDHDLMKEQATDRQSHPRRIAFGLPHNYGKPSEQQVCPHEEHLDRRASPLFVHIHECNQSSVAILSFLPARFLPVNDFGEAFISVGGRKIKQQSEEELYLPIHESLNRLLDQEKRVESFTRALEVRP